MLLLLTALAWCASAALSLSRSSIPCVSPPVIDLGYSRVQGYFNHTNRVYEWRGIRYAAAARFQAPRTPETTVDVQNATRYGPMCWQGTAGLEGALGTLPKISTQGEQSEDCLLLNVQAPARALEGHRLPVLVWIHGGGYSIGDGSVTSDLSEFLRLSGDRLVIVRVQYRLSAFGFLAGEAVKEQGVLNAGLLDQQFALQWVQQHVAKFGGDPGSVTVWGVSAGAGSILNHLVANGGNTARALGLEKPLFKAAILSSPFLPPQVQYNVPSAKKVYSELASSVGCANGGSSLDCLVNVDAAKLAAAAFANAAAAPWAVWTYVPVIDGSFLRDRASVLLKQGKAKLNGEYLTAINNAHEGTIWADPTLEDDRTTDPTVIASQFDRLLAGLFPQLTASEREAVAGYYDSSLAHHVGITVERMSEVIADSTFNCPAYWAAEAFDSSAHKGTFAYSPATHGWDTFYYLGDIFGGNRSRSSIESFDGTLAGAMLGSFDPNDNPVDPHVNPHWPTYDTREELVFQTVSMDPSAPADPVVVQSTSMHRFAKNQLARCEFWRGRISKNAGL